MQLFINKKICYLKNLKEKNKAERLRKNSKADVVIIDDLWSQSFL